MASFASPALKRDIQALQARLLPARSTAVEPDRVAFARELGLEPDPWQERLLRSDAPRVLMNCARQTGKSTLAALLALHRALASSGALVLILAPSERQAKELFTKVVSFYRALGASPGAIPADSYRKLGMELLNGSRVESLPGTEKTIRGFSGVDLLIVDEAARVSDELYYAVRPMLAVSRGALLMLSTPYGKRGVFFEEWSSGIGWERYEVWARECPRISADFLEEERRALPAWVYEQEYECAFAETDDQVFAEELVASAITSDVKPMFSASEATGSA
jgi:hypothetical protein